MMRHLLTVALCWGLCGVARAADAVSPSCPDLSGRFACPASETYKQAAMTVVVSNDLVAKTYRFEYDGKRSSELTADGVKRAGKKGGKWSRNSCKVGALRTETFSSEKSAEVASWSEQRINKDGDYEVTVTGGKISLVCRRAAAAKP